jgi:hypothetical protein
MQDAAACHICSLQLQHDAFDATRRIEAAADDLRLVIWTDVNNRKPTGKAAPSVGSSWFTHNRSSARSTQ